MTNFVSGARLPVSVVALVGLAVVSLFSQSQAPQKPSFEVASVKPNAPISGFPPRGGPQGNRFMMTAATLQSLLLYAYDLPSDPSRIDNRIIGGPSWADSDRFDVQAKADDTTTTLSVDRARLMLQSLLEERFNSQVGAGTASQIAPASEPAGSIFRALQDVGLRLESARAAIKVLIIDSVQKPAEN
jgi:hypothetical protein